MRALVIGGSGKLGGAVCRALAQRESRVALTFHRNEAEARSLEASLPEARAFRVDLGDASQVGPLVEEASRWLGGLDALVHCAAVPVGRADRSGTYEALADIDLDSYERLMAVNVRSVFLACQRAAGLIPGGANFVLVGSVDSEKPLPAPPHYVASRGALRGLAMGLTKELGPRNIRVNVVAPGLLDAGMSRAVPPELHREYLKHSALKRLGRLDEVASLVAWLAVENTYVTGRTIAVDGAL
jgi:NAD(P)-dependent dehydrogenase (short-subunit alcohol dehydrogenase family)